MTRETVPVVEKILGANDRIAASNSAALRAAGVYSINLMASPGAGKTSVIEQTLARLTSQYRIAVIDGDVATSLDADRAAAAGAVAVQVNTGGECHLDATMLNQALQKIDLQAVDLLLVENVGNLICTASFALGTDKNVLIASIPEGDDKPYKYPGMYRGIDALIINKIDLLPYVPFDMDYFRQGVEILNPGAVSFPLSCMTRLGIDEWAQWLSHQIERSR